MDTLHSLFTHIMPQKQKLAEHNCLTAFRFSYTLLLSNIQTEY